MNVGVRGLPGLRRETWGTRRLQLVETGTIRFEVYTHSPEKQEAGSLRQVQGRLSTPLRFAQDDKAFLDARWVREPRLVRVTGYGPLFDEGAFEADGHIRIDFGPDGPFLEEGVELDSVAARHVEENVRQLIELTAAVEKASGATARLLWSELGESLAQRLASRLGVAN